jgi:hypothetical protein
MALTMAYPFLISPRNVKESCAGCFLVTKKGLDMLRSFEVMRIETQLSHLLKRVRLI